MISDSPNRNAAPMISGPLALKLLREPTQMVTSKDPTPLALSRIPYPSGPNPRIGANAGIMNT